MVGNLVVKCLALKAALVGHDAKTGAGKRTGVDRGWIDDPKARDVYLEIVTRIDFLYDLLRESTAMTSTSTSRVVTW